MRQILPKGFTPIALFVAVAFTGGGCGSLNAHKDLERAMNWVEARGLDRPSWIEAAHLPAPPAEGPWTLSEKDAVMLAVATDPTVLAGIERVRAARADLVQAGLLPNPVLAFELAFPIAGSDGGTKVGVGLSAHLMTLLTRDRRLSIADAELTAVILGLSDHALRIAADARRAHAQVRFAREKLEPSRAAVSAMEKNVEVTRRQFEAGENTIIAVNRQSRTLLDIQRQVQLRESDLRKAEHTLLRVIGRADYMGPVQTPDPQASDDSAVPGEQEVIAMAIERRLDVAAARAQADAARRQAGLGASSLMEDLEIGAAFERDEGRKELGPAIAVPIPIFDLGLARAEKARALARMAEHAVTDVRNRAISEVRTAWTELAYAKAYVDRIQSQSMPLASQSLQSAESSVAAGEADATVTLEAESLLATVRLELVEARERLALAQIELARACGGSTSPSLNAE